MNMEKKCAGTRIAHVVAIHAKTARLALALMVFVVILMNERRREVSIYIAYAVVSLVVFLVESFVAVRYSFADPLDDPEICLMLVGLSLIWPITVPLFAAILLLIGTAKLAKKLAERTK